MLGKCVHLLQYVSAASQNGIVLMYAYNLIKHTVVSLHV